MQLSLFDFLQSTGPIKIFELASRLGYTDPKDVLPQLEELKKAGTIRVEGPNSGDLSQMSPEEFAGSFVELSRAAYRRSFAR